MRIKIFIFAILSIIIGSANAQITCKGHFNINNYNHIADKTIYIKPPSATKNTDQSNGRFYFGKIIDTETDFFENAILTDIDTVNIYKLNICAKNAYSLGILFNDIELKNGVELYIEGKNITLGALTNINNTPEKQLLTSQIEGDSITIILYAPKNSGQQTFKIKSICYDYANLFKQIDNLSKSSSSICETEKDVSCFENTDYQEIKQAICRYTITDKNQVYLCTGALVNNTKNDSTPYFLTAAHCLCSQSEAKNTVFYFNYEKTTCGGLNVAQTNQTISGATLVATSPRTKYGTTEYPDYDFTLLQLSSKPPHSYQANYLGWTTVESENYDSVACIHHPQGNYKKISISYPAVEISSYPNEYDDETQYKENSHWHIKKWDVGTTEGGSSGSPLINKNKQIIGILSGGFADCSSAKDDYFQMISKAWQASSDTTQQLKHYLSPDTDQQQHSNLEITNYPSPFVSGIWNNDSTIAKLWWKTADFECGFENTATTQDLLSVFLADVDIDGYDTKNVDGINDGGAYAWKVISSDGDFAAYNGQNCIASFTSNVQQANDYLTLPKITISKNSAIYFYAKSVGGISKLKISQNTKATNYSTIEDFDITEEWKLYKLSLTEYVGQTIYININNITPSGASTALLIDDFSIMLDTSIIQNNMPIGYNVFCNGELVKTIMDKDSTEYAHTVDGRGIFSFYVQNIFENEEVSDYANTIVLNNIQQNKTAVEPIEPETIKNYLFPNPANNTINFVAGQSYNNAVIYISTVDGKIIWQKRQIILLSNQKVEIDVSILKQGIYIFTIITQDKKNSYKFIKN